MIKELKVDSRAITERVLHLGRMASAEALVEGLTPVQWAGLSMRSETDRRSVHIVLTEKARAILQNDLFETWVRAVDTLSLGVRGQFANALQRMLGQVALERGLPTFGNCASCTHLEGDDCSRERQESYACGFSSKPLLLEELDGICINFVQGKLLPERGPRIGTAPR